MYSSLKSFLERLGTDDSEKIEFRIDDTRIAVAVLYYRVIMVDGKVRPQEMDRYRQILSDTLDVSEDELALFEAEVFKQSSTAKSLEPFADTIKNLPLAKRKEILKHMQDISASDAELHEFELNLVAIAAELLGLKGEWISSDPIDDDASKKKN